MTGTHPEQPRPIRPGGRRYVLGCDIGGTFTDFVLLDTATGELCFAKVLSSRDAPEQAIFDGIAQLDASQPGFLAQTSPVVHGTTLAINALIERTGPPVGMFVTEGFGDVLEMRTSARGDMWDLSGRLPAVLVPRWLRVGVAERVTADGTVVVPLDTARVAAETVRLREAGVAAVAVCFLNAHANPAHETAAATMIGSGAPGLPVTTSHDVLPVPGEFARFSATAANAYLMPIVSSYLPTLTAGLSERGLSADSLRILASEGSQCGVSVAAAAPIRFVESGPVGGVLAAQWVGRRSAIPTLLALDIGGTTAKTAIIRDGVAPIAEEYEVAREYRLEEGSGIPLNVPSVDLLEVGAGGGSIAFVDELGLIRVGPRSADSWPGPVVYMRGGEEPTLTDADVVLGLIDAGAFADGPTATARARDSIRGRIADRLGISVEDAAQRIRQTALATMAAGIQLQLARAGIDAADLTMVGYGGAGPLYAASLAEMIGITDIVIPQAASIFSAVGMVISPAAYTALRPLRAGGRVAVDRASLEHAFAHATADALAALRATDRHLSADDITFSYAIDARYRGQGQPTTVSVAGSARTDVDALRIAFEAEYARRFGSAHADQVMQIVGVRVTARNVDELVAARPPATANGPGRPPGRQQIITGTGLRAAVTVYHRAALVAGQRLAGPALVRDLGATVYLTSKTTALVNDQGDLHLTVDSGPNGGLA